MYSYKDTAGWHTESVDTEGWVGPYVSLALDSLNQPHISYLSLDGQDLKYAFKVDTDWQIEFVETSGYILGETSLVLDQLDHPHISYHKSADNDWNFVHELNYAYKSTSGWQLEVITTDATEILSLDLNQSGYPFIGYKTGGENFGDLCLAYEDSTGWHIQVVDSDESAGTNIHLKLDENGYSHISYIESGVLSYYTSETQQITEFTLAQHRFTSIAIDSSGLIHIVSYDQENKDLLYYQQSMP